jgi:hypothetical protein
MEAIVFCGIQGSDAIFRVHTGATGEWIVDAVSPSAAA